MTKFKIEGTLQISGTVSFMEEDEVLKDFRETIVSHWDIKDIAEHVLVSYAEGNDFVEGIGENGKDFEIEDYDLDWDLEKIEVK